MAAFADRLSKASGRGRVELARGLNDAGGQIFTIVRHREQHQMNVKGYRLIVQHTSSVSASPGNLTYQIRGDGKGLPIRDFPVEAAVGSPVTATPWGVAHTFKRSFMTRVRGLFRARTTSKRFPIRVLRGPSPAKELVKGETAEAFEASVPRLVLPLVMRRLRGLVP